MPDDNALVDAISTHFGPFLVSIACGRRVSFADAWNDPALRLRAINAAIRALNSERIAAAGTAPRAAGKQISTINNLLLGLLMQE
jgi:hypothetical protein